MSINKKLFSKAAGATDTLVPTKNFNTVLYTGTGATQNVGAYINQAAEFNGSTSKIAFSGSKSLTNRTISMWFNPSKSINLTLLDNTQGKVSGAVQFGRWNMLFNYGGLNYAVWNEYNGSQYGMATFYYTFQVGTWYHIAFCVESGNNAVYVNGASQTLTVTRGTSIGTVNLADCTLGFDRDASSLCYDGKIDQVRIFDKALSSSEVTTLYGETFDSATKSTTDIFADRSALALYQFENNANDTGGASGYLNEGAIFNGSDTKVDINATSSTPVDFSNKTFSITAWIKGTGFTTDDRTIISKYSGSNNSTSSFFFDVRDNDQKLRVTEINGTSALGLQSNDAISENTWTHVAYVRTSTTCEFFINGTTSGGSQSRTSNINDGGTTTISIGERQANKRFNGIIDEVRIYSDALTSTEVGHIYNNTTASIPTDNLEAYYKFDGTFQDEQQAHDGVGTNVTFRYDGTASNVSFQGATRFTPDFVWTKMRSSGNNHQLFDIVRGVTKELESNTTAAEVTNADSLTAFNSNGFTVGSSNNENQDGVDYVAWCWKGGGAAVSNSNGSIASSVSANTEAGFSIITWTGTQVNGSIGHGLTAAPNLIIVKDTSNSYNWYVFTKPSGASNNLRLEGLNTTNAATTQNSQFTTTSSLIENLTTTVSLNTSGATMLAYAFHDVTGYQKIGTYTGNNTGGNETQIVQTDFEPAWLLIKNTSSSSNNWIIVDNKRDTSNPRTLVLETNTSDAEATQTVNVNFLTNGFQLATGNSDVNDNGAVYLYWAIAADPSTASTPSVTNAFDVVNYTGTGAAKDILTDCNADFAWIKSTSNTTAHELHDTVRGEPSRLSTNSTAADPETANGFVNFIDKGFSVDGTGSGGEVNTNGRSYIAWLWSAGSHEGLLPSANTQGSTTSTVSVNDAAGFSIVKFTTDTNTVVGHGLSAAPELIIVKRLDSTSNWFIYNSVVSGRGRGFFTTDAFDNSGVPTFGTSTITFQTNDPFSSGADVIMYCFRSISGYSAIGSYNGTSSSQSITLGFKPSFLLVKETNNATASSWRITDRVRGTNNLLFPDQVNAQDTGGNYARLDSNGFTQQGLDSNVSGQEYFYYAVK